ncbi:MAG: hypothetical protein IT186_16050 [Acidobacteria bacterium]|nr:hypothetical protein [Acidobacteriota bacterium]
MNIETWYEFTSALVAFSNLTEDDDECYPGNEKLEAAAREIQRLAVPWESYEAAGRGFGCPPPPEMREHFEWLLDRSLAVVDIKRWLAEKGIPTYRRENGRLVQITFPTN